MKEASGEANLTVITFILIGVIVAVATPVINSMLRGTAQKGCCENYGGVWQNGGCHPVLANGTVDTSTTINRGDYWTGAACTEAAGG